MVFREVSVIEVREALRAWLAGKSERAVAAQAGVDRKTSRRYVRAAVAAGLSREGGEEQLTDELIGQVVSVVRPVRPDGHGQGWAELEARQGADRHVRSYADNRGRHGCGSCISPLPGSSVRRWRPSLPTCCTCPGTAVRG